MNATNIEAYALSKGIKTAYKDMTQSQKAEVAMQMFFENTEQYAGNFAKESTETISGSLGLLQAALGSFTAGLGNANADMTNLTENLVEAFQAVVANITPIIQNLINALPAAFAAMLPAIGALLPDLLSTVTMLFRQVLDAVFLILPELIPVAVDALMVVADALIDNIPLLIEAALVLVTSLAGGLTDALPELIPAAVDAVITVVETLIDNIDMLIDAAIAIIMALADGLIESLPKLIEKAPDIIAKLVSAIIENAPKLLAAAVALIWQLSAGLATEFGSILTQVGGWIDANILQPIKDKLTEFYDVGSDIVKGIWNGIKAGWDWLTTSVSSLASSLLDAAKSALGIHSPSSLFRDEVGAMMAKGIGVGFADQMKSVTNQMNASIPTSFSANATIDGAIGRMANVMAGTVNAMGAKSEGQQPLRVEIPLFVNGKEFYRASISDLWSVMSSNPRVVSDAI